ncbi:MAG: V-type ATPase subunit [Chloroflexota bacterium]
MPDYEYGNARLRVMKSRLLSRRTLNDLAETGSIQGMIAALTKTAYQKSIESALTRFIGMNCIDEALHADLIATIGAIGKFYHEETGKLIALVLRSYDIENLKTILRGLSRNVPSGEIIPLLLPIGELKINTLRELARLNNTREAIDLIASQSLPFASPLLKLRAERPGAETFEMELALDQWHFDGGQQTLRSQAGEDALLNLAFALDADLANVMTALRFAHAPRDREILRERLRTEDPKSFFIKAGRIPFEALASAARQDAVSPAVEALAGTSFGPALRAGFELYSRSNRLSDIEKRLKKFRLMQLAQMIDKDPLGIGVPLGYIALKVNEIGNIRWIAHGLELELKPDAIQAEVETLP